MAEVVEAFQNINWFLAIPLGLAAVFFFVLTFRRFNGFYVSLSQPNKSWRMRNRLLSFLDIGAFTLSLMLILSPLEMWIIMAPCGLLLIILLIPIGIIGEKQYLRSTGFWMGKLQKIAGFSLDYEDKKLRNIDSDVKPVWYEYASIAFISGCLAFSITIFIPAIIASITNRPPNSVNFSLTTGIIAWVGVGAIIMLWAYLRYRSPRKTR